MNRFYRFRISGLYRFLLTGLLVSAVACTTEIDLFVAGDPVPLVYCLLDPDSTHQYVRVAQTFIRPLDNPDYVPDREDLLIKEPVEVYLVAEQPGAPKAIYYGTLIDPYPKDSGWFPQDVNQVYRIECALIPACSYSLYIHFLNTNRVIYGQTTSFGHGFAVIDPEKVPGRNVHLFKGTDFYVRYKPASGGSVYQAKMTFRYAELAGGVRSERSLVLQQPMVIATDTTLKFIEQRISGERFLIDVSRSLKPVEGVRRIPLGFDFHLTVGGDDLAVKIHAENNTQSFSVLEVNSFDNAFGVFSCMSHRFVTGLAPSHFTIDTLAMGPLTRNLGFLSSAQIDSLNYDSKK